MTRGLFAGVFWGLFTGGLVLMVAALVLDHRAAQPIAVPGYLIDVTADAPVVDWEPPMTGAPVAVLSSDPVLEAGMRQLRRPFEAAAVSTPVHIAHPVPAALHLSGTSAPLGLAPAPAPSAARWRLSAADVDVRRNSAVRPNAPQITAVPDSFGLSVPSPEFAPRVALSIEGPAAPQSGAPAIGVLAMARGDVARQVAPRSVSQALIEDAPIAPKDAQVSAPKPVGPPANQVLSHGPVDLQTVPERRALQSEDAPRRIISIPAVAQAQVAAGPSRWLSYPPAQTSKVQQAGEVVIVLAVQAGFGGDVPPWAAAVALPLDVLSADGSFDRPVLLAVDSTASSDEIREMQTALPNHDMAGVIVVPSNEQVSSDVIALIQAAPLVLGTAPLVQFEPKTQPIYRWSTIDPDAVQKDLIAAQARALRDGQSVVVVPDVPEVRAAVEAWNAGLDPAVVKTAPFAFSGF